MGVMITCHGYYNGCDNPVYNAHRNVGAHYTQECIMHGKIWYVLVLVVLG